MERVVKKFRSFKEADKWNIDFQVNLTPEERFDIADALKRMAYGENMPDVRASYGRK